jgi:hypothetical protein
MWRPGFDSWPGHVSPRTSSLGWIMTLVSSPHKAFEKLDESDFNDSGSMYVRISRFYEKCRVSLKLFYKSTDIPCWAANMLLKANYLTLRVCTKKKLFSSRTI